MSIESVTQRVAEIQAMVGASPSGSGFAADAPPSGFADQLSMKMNGDSNTGQLEDPSTMQTPGDQTSAFYNQMNGLGGMNPLGDPAAAGGTGQKIVELAKKEIGVKETSWNDSSRIHEYRTATAGAEDSPGPWCAYFVSWLCKEAGAPIGKDGKGTGYVPTLEDWGKNTNRWIEHGGAAQAGDIVIFDRGADGVADHTGIVERVDQDGTLHTIEGNSSDQVIRRTYTAGDGTVAGYVRPG